MTFKLITLVDITPTGVIRATNADCSMHAKRNQQRNFETVLQVLSLRTQPHVTIFPMVQEYDSKKIKNMFGETFYGKTQKVWTFFFAADHPTSYDTCNGELEGLVDDFEQVPIITGLSETACFMLPIFYPRGSIKNVHISKIYNN